jgi:excisionase family DNA binding protein
MTRPHIHQDPADPFLTTLDAAVLLGVSLRSVQLWVEAGKLPAGRTPGGHRRIRTSAVRALAAEQGLADPVIPLQAQLDAALADGRRLHDAYLGAERELEAARAEVALLRLQLPLICKDAELLDGALDPDDWVSDERMTDVTARILARLDAIGVRAEGSNEPPACRNCGGSGADCLGKMGCRSQQLVVQAQITGPAT